MGPKFLELILVLVLVLVGAVVRMVGLFFFDVGHMIKMINPASYTKHGLAASTFPILSLITKILLVFFKASFLDIFLPTTPTAPLSSPTSWLVSRLLLIGSSTIFIIRLVYHLIQFFQIGIVVFTALLFICILLL